jgi:hypothetical protein
MTCISSLCVRCEICFAARLLFLSLNECRGGGGGGARTLPHLIIASLRAGHFEHTVCSVSFPACTLCSIIFISRNLNPCSTIVTLIPLLAHSLYICIVTFVTQSVPSILTPPTSRSLFCTAANHIFDRIRFSSRNPSGRFHSSAQARKMSNRH